MTRIEIEFNERGFSQEYRRLQENVDELNAGVDLCKEITENTIIAFSIDAVNLWLTNRADFPNIVAIADLLGTKPQYIKLIELDDRKPQLESEFISFDNGSYNITDNAITALKSTFTSYLKDEKLDDYKQLQKVVKIMNNLTKESRLALFRNANLDYSLNLFRLNHNV
ncbi:hypothetical protein N8273_00575 [Algibacter sp.]|nr:hypothetical protein [Algibacter sp.]